MLAIVNDRFDLAAKLLDLGADANDGSLYYAVEMHDATTDWRAKDGTRLRADHPNKLTALDLIRVLLDKGADPNKPFSGQMHSASMCCDTKANATPFYRAAVAADVEGMKLMIAKGADLEWSPPKAEKGPRDGFGPSNAGKTPLMVAMDGGKGVGMAGGPGDIREGAEAPFREKSNRNPLDAMQAADRRRREGECKDARRRLRAAHRGVRRQARRRALAREERRGSQPQGRRGPHGVASRGEAAAAAAAPEFGRSRR